MWPGKVSTSWIKYTRYDEIDFHISSSYIEKLDPLQIKSKFYNKI